MSDKTPSSALAGLKVLDLTRVRAGPACCRILGDFGADIIKIDAPEGLDKNAGISGDRHGYDMLNLHRNKRSLTLNLKSEDGLALFLDMVKRADVVVENFRPDVKNRLGIDYGSLKAVNPRIVLASISGFGQDGPAAGRAGFDQIAQGMGGLMGVTGFPGEAPLRAGTAVADLSAGTFAATGILVALMERTTSGQGQWVQTSLLQAQIAMMDFQAARYLIDGEVPAQGGNDHPTVTPMGVVETSDGHVNLGVGGDGQWQAFCDAIDRPDLKADETYATMSGRTEKRDEIWAILRPIFATKTSADWITLLDKHSVPVGPIYRMDEVFADPQVEHLGVAQNISDPMRGDVRVVAVPIDLSRTPSSLVSSVPDAGEHTDIILNDLGLDADRIADLRSRGVI
ncbi:CaiB/BaiF CoA-transferase family protein [Ahrensia sp. R2A130]|uniref:CaiB/BaiF CoA transferase family protein n=1 Tax=Ahrensia sp. R2A130 TaxID=744979 RepID=UPI0001E0E105|nr:CaiB/BaiF CoA-transferase family protein [Ahrensia sp. R2A130]EFL87540.1 L-carnitine dehydratase/bile acid-inducible protein F [Ahrensia sp. R2A130]